MQKVATNDLKCFKMRLLEFDHNFKLDIIHMFIICNCTFIHRSFSDTVVDITKWYMYIFISRRTVHVYV